MTTNANIVEISGITFPADWLANSQDWVDHFDFCDCWATDVDGITRTVQQFPDGTLTAR